MSAVLNDGSRGPSCLAGAPSPRRRGHAGRPGRPDPAPVATAESSGQPGTAGAGLPSAVARSADLADVPGQVEAEEPVQGGERLELRSLRQAAVCGQSV